MACLLPGEAGRRGWEVLLLPQEGSGWQHRGGGGRGWRNGPGLLSCPQLWWMGSRGEFSPSEAAQLEAVALSLEPREGRGRPLVFF